MATLKVSGFERDDLTIWLGGPGKGESVVVRFPDGRWMVMDCWEDATWGNFPLNVLRQFGVDAVDLLIVSHPDEDHIGGLSRLCANMDAKEVWSYAQDGLKDLVDGLLDVVTPQHRTRLNAFRQARLMLEEMENTNRATIGQPGMAWPAQPVGYKVHCIAPCPADQSRYRVKVRDFMVLSQEDNLTPAIRTNIVNFVLSPKASSLDWDGNVASLAVAIEWGAHKVLLAGDVLCSPPSQRRGWTGVLDVLARRGMLHLVQDLKVVKVAHHGSEGAIDVPVWSQHMTGLAGERVGWGLIAPFRNHRLPRADGLRALRGYLENVAISSAPEQEGSNWSQVRGAGWKRQGGKVAGDGPWVSLRLKADGAISASRGSLGNKFSTRGAG